MCNFVGNKRYIFIYVYMYIYIYIYIYIYTDIGNMYSNSDDTKLEKG